jgi:RNA polymerase sigma factor (sigma-70 family)
MEIYAARPVTLRAMSRVPHSQAVPKRSSPFDELFRAEYPRVVAIANRILAEPGDAEDVAQEVFLDFHRRQDPRASFAPAWLHAAAAHRALNVIRGRRRRMRREQRYTAMRTDAPDPLEQITVDETRREVRAALARIKRRHATVLALRYAGLSYAEVAEAHGVGVGHVGTLLRRAEAALRKEIGNAPV